MEDTPGLPAFGDEFESVLLVVAHPDDIEYGTAAAVAAWTAAGKTVTYFLLTRGEAGIDTMPPDQAAVVREQEERDGAALVGVHDVDFGTHRDGVVEYGLDLRRDIAREIRRRRPDVVITGDYHDRFVGMFNQADHRAVGLATADAVADAGNRWIFPELATEGLEPWTGVRRLCFAGAATPTHHVDVTAYVAQAVASLEAHDAYNSALPDSFPKPAELVPMILRMGGEAVGLDAALLLDVIERR